MTNREDAARKLEDEAAAAARALDKQAVERARELLVLAKATASALEMKLFDLLGPLRDAVDGNTVAVAQAILLAEGSLAETRALRERIESLAQIIETNHA